MLMASKHTGVAFREVIGKWTAFIPLFSNQWTLKALYNIVLTFTYSCTHSHIDGGVDHAGRQPARQEQSGCLAQGHPDTQLGGARDRTSNLLVTSQPVLPPEPHASDNRLYIRDYTTACMASILKTWLQLIVRIVSFYVLIETHQTSIGHHQHYVDAGQRRVRAHFQILPLDLQT